MTNAEAVNWLINITADIGKIEHQELWHYEQALTEIREMLETEPQRMRGRWIGCDNSDHWKCSVCGTRAAFWFSEETSSELELDMSEWLSDFCPNCGCQMNGDEEDEQ